VILILLQSNLGTASTLWSQAQIRQAKKRVLYVIRHLDFVVQVCEEGTITCYAQNHVNDYLAYVLTNNYGSWEAFRLEFDVRISDYRQRLRDAAASYQLFEASQCNVHGAQLLQQWFNCHPTLQEQQRLLCLKYTLASKGNVWVLQNTVESPTASSQVARLCNRAVVCVGVDGLRLIALGVPSMVPLIRPSLCFGAVNRVALERFECVSFDLFIIKPL
jgi:hypothetical protein